MDPHSFNADPDPNPSVFPNIFCIYLTCFTPPGERKMEMQIRVDPDPLSEIEGHKKNFFLTGFKFFWKLTGRKIILKFH